MRRGLYYNKIYMPQACNFIKKETLTQVFSCEFSEFLRTPFFQNTSEELLLNFTNENKASENETSNRWF